MGYQRVQEIENPELAQTRMRELYKEKGYPDDWIEKRVRGIAVRDELTGEWQQRGISDQKEFAIPTRVLMAAYSAIGLGTLSGGWRIVRTMGGRLTRLKPRSGFCAETGAAAAVLIFENTWAAPFGAAIRRAGGQLSASGRIPTQAILAALQTEEAEGA